MPEPKKRKPIAKRRTRKAVPKTKKMETNNMSNETAATAQQQQNQTPPPVQPVINPPEAKPEKKASRRERVPLGTPRLKLAAPKRPGFHRHWLNDVGGRLEEAEAGGYHFVTDDGMKIGETAVGSGNQDIGSRVSRIVGTNPDGSPMRAYLMEIEQEYYDEDQKTKQKRLDQIDDQIRNGTFNPDNDNDTKRYVPSEGITYK